MTKNKGNYHYSSGDYARMESELNAITSKYKLMASNLDDAIRMSVTLRQVVYSNESNIEQPVFIDIIRALAIFNPDPRVSGFIQEFRSDE